MQNQIRPINRLGIKALLHGRTYKLDKVSSESLNLAIIAFPKM